MIPAARAERALLAIAAFAALAYLFVGGFIPNPIATLIKASMCVALAVLAMRQNCRLLGVALLFSALGDALLRLGGQLFVPALGSFLVTHILYATIFVRAPGIALGQMPLWRHLLMAAVPIFALAFTSQLWPQLGALKGPVAIYIVAIVVMTMLSLRVSIVWVSVGAVSFMSSDSLIAAGRFLERAEWQGPAIWITYALAQFCIALGVLRLARASRSQ